MRIYDTGFPTAPTYDIPGTLYQTSAYLCTNT